MSAIQQDITVKIKALVDGLSNVKELAGYVSGLKDLQIGGSSSSAGDTGALVDQINNLADAVDSLSKKAGPTKLQDFTSIVSALNAIIQGLGGLKKAAEGVQAVASFFKSLSGGEKEAAGIAKLTNTVSNLADLIRSKFKASAKEVEQDAEEMSKGVGDSTTKVEGFASRVRAAFDKLKQRFGGGSSGSAPSGAGAAAGAVEGAVGAEAGEAGAGLAEGAGAAAAGAGAAEAAPAVGALGAAAGAAVSVVSALVAGLAALGAIAAVVVAALAAVVAIVAVFTAGVAGLTLSVNLGVAALAKIGPEGVKLHEEFEQARLSIAGTVASLNEITVAGQAVEGAQKFAVAFQLADEQAQKLRVDTLQTGATFEQLSAAFQEAVKPGVAAGLDLDQIRQIVVQATQAATALNVPLDQVGQEVASILSGTIDENSQLANALGISEKDVKLWTQKGTLADQLTQKMKGFAEAGAEANNTLDGLKTKLQNALAVFEGEATQQAFDTLKEEFQKLLPELFDFKNARVTSQFEALASLADDVLTRLIRVAGTIAQDIVAGLQKAGQFVEQNRALIDQILTLLEASVRQLLQVGEQFVQIGTDTETWHTTLLLVRDVLVVVNVIIAALVQQLREAQPLLLLLLAAANAALLASGVGALGGLGAPAKGGASTGAPAGDITGGVGQFRIGLKTKLPGGGGGGGGGGGQKSQVPQLERELDKAKIEAALAEIKAKYDAIKQDVDASVQAIKDGLSDATVSISDAYRLEAEFADKALRAENDRLDAEVRAAGERHRLALQDLNPDLKPKERLLAIEVENTKLVAETAKLEGERALLVEKTADEKARLVNEEAKAQEQLQKSVADIENQLDALSNFGGSRAEAAAAEIEARFAETRRQLVINFGEASHEVEHLDQLIQQLTERAKFSELSKDVENAFGRLRDEEDLLNDDVTRGQLSAADALKKRLELEREVKRQVQDTLIGLKAVAEATGDPQLLEAVRKLEHEWKNLGTTIDATAKEIDDSIRKGLEDTLVNIITRAKTAKEAFLDFLRSIVAEIARIVAANLVEKLFGNILRTNPQGSSIGGILAPILTGGASNGTQQGSSSGNVFGSIDDTLKKIPGVILNFNRSSDQGLGGLKTSTDGMRGDVNAGIGQVNSNFGSAIGLLGNIASGILAMAAAAVVSAVTNILHAAGAGAAPQAEGGFQSASPGGRLVRVAEAGFDEVILPTDPKYKKRASRLMGEFIRRTGLVPDFGAVVLQGALAGVPSFEAGGFALDTVSPGAGAAGDAISVSVPLTIHTPNRQSFAGSEQAIKRDVARAAQEGVRRAKSQTK
jgi:hypothetical protein